ncbi:LLM class flavin-dependent oxidoreductase [Streptomyces sp. KLMMK]|uniref:LLM class flavin-dependent oxidoreductase n=1 Tax=Streptomyces sp. KLMMK TaxID=3109353 RepID=UPI003FA77B06
MLAGLLDEGLDLLARYWSGEPVTHHGRHHRVEDVTLLPTPVQRPRCRSGSPGPGPTVARCAGLPAGTHRGGLHLVGGTSAAPSTTGSAGRPPCCAASNRGRRRSSGPSQRSVGRMRRGITDSGRQGYAVASALRR